MDISCVLLDTNFFIRLLNESDKLHDNTLKYYKHFLDKQSILKCSTISIAEYCVRGKLDELPLKDILIIPFNINHAQRAGELARSVFESRKELNIKGRNVIPNDTKLFAQADIEPQIKTFITSDKDCIKIYNHLKNTHQLNFEIKDFSISFADQFGLLGL